MAGEALLLAGHLLYLKRMRVLVSFKIISRCTLLYMGVSFKQVPCIESIFKVDGVAL